MSKMKKVIENHQLKFNAIAIEKRGIIHIKFRKLNQFSMFS